MSKPSRAVLRLVLSGTALVGITAGCLFEEDAPPDGDGGSSACYAPTATDCDGVCVDTQSDADHCGRCGNGCETACLNGGCINCPNVDGYWSIVGGDCPVTVCEITQSDCGGSVTCYDETGEPAGSGTVTVLDGSVRFSATAGSCDLDLVGDDASGPCASLGITVCNVVAHRD